jgi:hypothetical protein
MHPAGVPAAAGISDFIQRLKAGDLSPQRLFWIHGS